MTIHVGDCVSVLKMLDQNSVDAIVTDPPYELGFMGKSWDNTGIANSVEMWAAALRVLKPGGQLLAFSGTRTYHRMASAIEDAGFEVRDMIEWVYGSGFPKSLNIGKAVDKLQGNVREEVWDDRYKDGRTRQNLGKDHFKMNALNGLANGNRTTKGTSEWEGWGTALKPAHEPICMARKPLAEKTVAENVLKYGTGGINIDDSRVATADTYSYPNGAGGNGFHGGVGREPDGSRIEAVESSAFGRFPANLIHDKSEEVGGCFPNDEGRFFKSIVYTAKASKRERGVGNNHPTVKPVALMEYLITMVSTPGSTILDPFAGSGTTLVAAKLAGRNAIGIELSPEYAAIAERRVAGVPKMYLGLFD